MTKLSSDHTKQPLPDQKEAFDAFSKAALAEGTLSRKTKVLVAAAVASLDQQASGENNDAPYVRQAREAGATDGEIAEALSVTWSQGGGTQVFWMKEDLADLLGEDWRREFVPEADRAFWDFKRVIFDGEALDRKTKELIAVAVSCMLRCRHCTRGHIQSALKEGATRQEVAEALAVLWMVGSRKQMAGSQTGYELDSIS